MGCGCKNGNNLGLPSKEKIREIERQKELASQTIKETIRKTVEKYFNNSEN